MATVTIQAPPGAVTLTIEDGAGRTIYFLSPADSMVRMVRLDPIRSPLREHIRQPTLQTVGSDRIMCPRCDGWPIDCRLCDTDGTISEQAMTLWMVEHGTVLGDALDG